MRAMHVVFVGEEHRHALGPLVPAGERAGGRLSSCACCAHVGEGEDGGRESCT